MLLSKSIAQPQGVAIYDPTRIIRALDIFVAIANMSGIAPHESWYRRLGWVVYLATSQIIMRE